MHQVDQHQSLTAEETMHQLEQHWTLRHKSAWVQSTIRELKRHGYCLCRDKDKGMLMYYLGSRAAAYQFNNCCARELFVKLERATGIKNGQAVRIL